MRCKICENVSKKKFEGIVLQKYQVSYFQCINCGFIQTEHPFWLKEAYEKPITDLDIGIISRNLKIKDSVEPLLYKLKGDADGPYLDVGGGYGIFVRLMRDAGFNFFLYDPHCANLFAKGFSKSEEDLSKERFQAITFFEVLEHVENPISFFKNYKDLSDTFIFSTELMPASEFRSVNDWWYFAPETGQHISFFSSQSLQILAKKMELSYSTDGYFLHCFSSGNNLRNPFKKGIAKRLLSKVEKVLISEPRKKSLLQSDYQTIRERISNEGTF